MRLVNHRVASDLTREELYDLVWSRPVQRAAEQFAISDVALAKLCRRRQVPLPPRGYWARKQAGQNPTVPVLLDFIPPPPPPKRVSAAEQRELDRQREVERESPEQRPAHPAAYVLLPSRDAGRSAAGDSGAGGTPGLGDHTTLHALEPGGDGECDPAARTARTNARVWRHCGDGWR